MSVVINPIDTTKFKLRAVKVFASDEWFAGATKNYRSAFDRAELDYVRCELSFFNKVQRNETWNCKVVFKCFQIIEDSKKEICSIDNDVNVKPEDDIVFVRDGWGNEKVGTFWNEGKYTWEVFVDNMKIGEVDFFVNGVGRVTRQFNPYFAVDGFAFYTGDHNGFEQVQREYHSTINGKETKYLWVEFELVNKVMEGWNYELFFNFYDATRRLKGQVIREGVIERNKRDYKYKFDVGWGNVTPGSWKSEHYFVDVVFMNTIIASGCFFVRDFNKGGKPDGVFVVPG